jgi:hypothetical protein
MIKSVATLNHNNCGRASDLTPKQCQEKSIRLSTETKNTVKELCHHIPHRLIQVERNKNTGKKICLSDKSNYSLEQIRDDPGNGNTYSFYVKYTNIWVIDIDQEEVPQWIQSMRLPYTITYNGFHFYCRMELDKRYSGIDVFEGFKGDLIHSGSNIWETTTRELFQYTEDIPYIKCELVCEHLRNKDKKQFVSSSIDMKNSSSLVREFGEFEFSHFIDETQTLLNLLHIDRCDNYTNWVKCGMILKQYDEFGFELWNEWSKKSLKYDEYETRRTWDSLQPDGKIRIGSLYAWAKYDNPNDYREMIQFGNVRSFMNMIRNEVITTQIAAEVIQHKFKHKFKYCPIIKTWYILNEFNIYETLHSETELYNIVADLAKYVRKDIERIERCEVECKQEGEESVSKFEERLSSLRKQKSIQIHYQKKSLRCLETRTFQTKVIETLRNLLEDCLLHKRLNTQNHLFVFSDGYAFDCVKGHVRQVQPEDYISQTCGYEYPHEYNIESLTEIKKFMYSIFPDNETVEYVNQVIASCLSGERKYEQILKIG